MEERNEMAQFARIEGADFGRAVVVVEAPDELRYAEADVDPVGPSPIKQVMKPVDVGPDDRACGNDPDAALLQLEQSFGCRVKRALAAAHQVVNRPDAVEGDHPVEGEVEAAIQGMDFGVGLDRPFGLHPMGDERRSGELGQALREQFIELEQVPS